MIRKPAGEIVTQFMQIGHVTELTETRLLSGRIMSEVYRERWSETREFLCRLLYVAIVDVISRNTSTEGNLSEMLHADELAVVADSESGINERLVV